MSCSQSTTASSTPSPLPKAVCRASFAPNPPRRLGGPARAHGCRDNVHELRADRVSSLGKSGPKLKALDDYRYNEAIQTFGGENPKREMDLDAVKTLVDWKL